MINNQAIFENNNLSVPKRKNIKWAVILMVFIIVLVSAIGWFYKNYYPTRGYKQIILGEEFIINKGETAFLKDSKLTIQFLGCQSSEGWEGMPLMDCRYNINGQYTSELKLSEDYNYIFTDTKTDKISLIIYNDCSQLEKQAGKYASFYFDCWYNKALTLKNAAYCKNFSDISRQSSCIQQLVQSLKNSSEFMKDVNDYKICLEIPIQYKDSQEGCAKIFFEYFKTKDPTLNFCQEIEDTYYRDVCYSMSWAAIDNGEYCDKFTGEQIKNNCFEDLAQRKNDENICVKAENPQKFCLYIKAKKENNAALCNEIKDYFVRDDCIVQLNPHNLDAIQDPRRRAEIAADWAFEEKKPEICDLLIKKQMLQGLDYDAHNTCLGLVAIKMGDKNLCERINYGTYWGSGYGPKDTCYKTIGVGFSDEKLCEKIISKDLKMRCLSELAIKIKNPQICEKIKDYWVREIYFNCINLSK